MPFTPSPGAVVVTAGGEAAITNAAYRTWGLGSVSGWTLTPQSTGRVLVIVTGNVVSGAAATDTVQLRHGTGAAPAHDVADTGTADGGQVSIVVGAAATSQFALSFVVTGLVVPVQGFQGQAPTAAVPVWFDVAVKASVSTVQLTNINCIAIEL